MNPLVSIVIPVYNAESYLQETLDSVFAQTYSNWELILIDDASTDGSAAICKSIKDKRVKFFQNPENRHVAETRNRGLRESKGKYIAFLDSDDLALPHRIEKEVDFLENNPGYVLCAGWAAKIDSEGKPINQRMRTHLTPDEFPAALCLNNYFLTSTVTVRRDTVKTYAFEKRLSPAEDYGFWVKLKDDGKQYVFSEIFVRYRVHDSGISTDNIKKQNGVRQVIGENAQTLEYHYEESLLTDYVKAMVGFQNSLTTVENAGKFLLEFTPYLEKKYGRPLTQKIIGHTWYLINFRNAAIGKEVIRTYRKSANSRRKSNWLELARLYVEVLKMKGTN